MPVKKFYSNCNVLEASQRRIQSVFDSGAKIYLSFSCGKDSLVMSSLVYDMIMQGKINREQLTVTFVDEEGLYKSMVDAAIRWYKKFTAIGVPFIWLCLPFKQVCVLDKLSASESWITWEPGKEWIRQPPDFAVKQWPSILKYPGQMNYQTFCTKAFRDGIQLVGLRAVESLTRYNVLANLKMDKLAPGMSFYPIYDWGDSDVWLYIKNRNLEFPEIYMVLYEAGVTKRNLRLCAFFGDCGTQGLRWISQTDPELWERIERREPNAYLVLLYWDSEMFRRSSNKRRALEDGEEKKDYKAMCEDLLFYHPERYTIAPETKEYLPQWRAFYKRHYSMMTQKHCKMMYEGILYGDPKKRIYRILYTQVWQDYSKEVERECIKEKGK